MRALACVLVLAASVVPATAAGGSLVRSRVGPRRRLGSWLACYTADGHAIRSASWTKERDVDCDPVATASTTVSTGFAGWRSWGLTDLVFAWATGALPNRGLRLKRAEEEEDFGVRGSYFPSSSFGIAALRPRLVAVSTAPRTSLSR